MLPIPSIPAASITRIMFTPCAKLNSTFQQICTRMSSGSIGSAVAGAESITSKNSARNDMASSRAGQDQAGIFDGLDDLLQPPQPRSVMTVDPRCDALVFVPN